jgi:hypothetical protein
VYLGTLREKLGHSDYRNSTRDSGPHSVIRGRCFLLEICWELQICLEYALELQD